MGLLVLPDSAALSESSAAAEDDELTQVHAMGPIVEPPTAAAASSSGSSSSSSRADKYPSLVVVSARVHRSVADRPCPLQCLGACGAPARCCDDLYHTAAWDDHVDWLQ